MHGDDAAIHRRIAVERTAQAAEHLGGAVIERRERASPGPRRADPIEHLRDEAGEDRLPLEPVPTDERNEALDALRIDLAVPSRVELMPEIKTGPGGQRYDGIEEKVVALVQSRGLVERTTVQAFQAETVRRVRQLEPALRTMLVAGRSQLGGAPATEAVRQAKAADATDLGLDHRVIDRTLVDAARAGGLRLSAWTVNTEADMRRLIELGVDVIMTARPDLLVKVLGRN